MKKMFLIGLKDVRLAFRDRAALILMLAAPFLLTLGMGFVTGRVFGTETSGGLSEIPVLIVNQDDGAIGQALAELFQSPELAGLVDATILGDAAEARRQIDADAASAAVIIPAGFSRGVSTAGAAARPVELYTNPTRETSAGVIRTIVEEFTQRLATQQAAIQVTVGQLIRQGVAPASDAARLAERIAANTDFTASENTSIRLETVNAGREAVEFDVLAFIAPGMALMFLMFTVSNGGRSLLVEQALGTLPRLLIAPITTAQVLGGKVIGIFLTGAAQMFILIGASALLFRLNWGDPLAVIALVLAAVFGASGWGLLITALAHSPGQVSGIGSAVMLIFGVLGGSFVSLEQMGPAIQAFSMITPNAWGLTGFSILAGGGSLAEIGAPIAALLGMGALLFAIAGFIISRQGFVRR